MTDLLDLNAPYVRVGVTIDGESTRLSGGWSAILKERWTKDGKPTAKITGRVFEGPPARVASQITTYVTDNDTGLTTPKGTSFEWRDHDSPIAIDIVVEAKPADAPPQVHTVEVLRKEIEVVEREVERQVFLDGTEDTRAAEMRKKRLAAERAVKH